MGYGSGAPRGARAGSRLIGLAALAAALMLASCESVNEGASDYRKAVIDKESGEGKPTDVNKKYNLTGPLAPKGGASTGTSDDEADVPIVKGNKFYVSLLQAFVGPDGNFRGSTTFGGNEEIVIVLRVRDSNDTDTPGRLAFYSDDVERGQFLNFSNLLTLGPADYKGGVVTIDLDEIRLIGTTKHIKEKLQELSAMDGAFGPDPAKRANWNALARNIFDLIDSDAYGTHYTLTLMPAGGVAHLPYPRFEAGNYVLMRQEHRDEPLEWDALQLDNNTGRLIAKNSSGTEYRNRSYVTLQINALRDIPHVTDDDTKIDKPIYKSIDHDKRK